MLQIVDESLTDVREIVESRVIWVDASLTQTIVEVVDSSQGKNSSEVCILVGG